MKSQKGDCWTETYAEITVSDTLCPVQIFSSCTLLPATEKALFPGATLKKEEAPCPVWIKETMALPFDLRFLGSQCVDIFNYSCPLWPSQPPNPHGSALEKTRNVLLIFCRRTGCHPWQVSLASVSLFLATSAWTALFQNPFGNFQVSALLGLSPSL